MAARGEMPDVIPYVLRIDLWYNANSMSGTLPERHGAPVNEKYAKDIGADGYAPDAGQAVDLAKKLMAGRYFQQRQSN